MSDVAIRSLAVRYHHIQLAMPAGGEAIARQFWLDLLGFTEVPKPPLLAERGGLWCRSGDVSVQLGIEAGFQPAQKVHPGFLVDDLWDLRDRLESAGFETTLDDLFPGHTRFYVADPFGNRLEFLQPDS